jgi:GTP-binding protein
MNAPHLVLIGRPNVGKSSLFNRILRRNLATVVSTPGATRDWNEAQSDWRGRPYALTDTGGLLDGSVEGLEALVHAQALRALDEADVVLMVVDSKVGMTDGDERIARLVTQRARPAVVLANKVDSPRMDVDAHPFYALGLGEPIPVSAITGRNITQVMERALGAVQDEQAVSEAEVDAVSIAVIGRPNVGKSSFVNALLAEERCIVHDTPGTTRDPIDSLCTIGDATVVLMDTAGLRRRTKIGEEVERLSAQRTLRALERCDVAIVLVDAARGITGGDVRIIREADEMGVPAVVAVNKWDLVPSRPYIPSEYSQWVRDRLGSLAHLPTAFVSALRREGVREAVDRALALDAMRRTRVPTSQLNRFVEETVAARTPRHRGRRGKLFYATQDGVRPPTFVFFANDPALITPAYRQYLRGRLRRAFGFEGVPVRLVIRGRDKKSGR